MSQATAPLGNLQSVETASDLRQKLHMMKMKTRNEFDRLTNEPPIRKFLKSHWATSIFTAIAVFISLYLMNPHFVQEEREKYNVSKPDVKKVLSWSLASALFVGLSPIVYQKFLAK